jgi:hypothetical protein
MEDQNMQEEKKTTTLSNVDPKVVSEIHKFLRLGDRVEAMKVYMNKVGGGLKISKDAIDKEFDFLKQEDSSLIEIGRKVDAEREKWFAKEILSNPNVKKMFKL